MRIIGIVPISRFRYFGHKGTQSAFSLRDWNPKAKAVGEKMLTQNDLAKLQTTRKAANETVNEAVNEYVNESINEYEYT